MDKIKVISFLLFLFCYLCILVIFISFIIKYYGFFSDYEYIWFCSKILTVKNLVNNNNNQYQVFYGYNNEGKRITTPNHKTYLNYLKLIEDNGCKKNYKICGILDTYGNKFCYHQNSDCPINDIIIDSPYEASKYNGYDSYNYGNTGDKLYYKIGNVNSNIIVYWYINFNSFPKYIDGSNFILDKDAFYEIFGKNDDEDDDDKYNDDDDDDDNDNDKDKDKMAKALTNLVQSSINAHKFQQLNNYINKKIKEEENIDTYFKKIYYNEYVKSYIGFRSIDDIEKFNTIDFSLYKNIFPNIIVIIFSFICGFIFLIDIFIFIGRVINEIKGNSNCCEKCDCIFSYSSIIIYLGTFLGFFFYFIFIYKNVFNNESFKIAKSIKADKFIENFLKEFYEHFEKNSLIICSIIFFALSGISYILAWIIIPIMECYKKRNQNENNNLYFKNMENDYQRRIRFNHYIVTQNMNRQPIKTDIYQVTNRQLNGDEAQKEDNNNNKEEKNEEEKEMPHENQDENKTKDNQGIITLKNNARK